MRPPGTKYPILRPDPLEDINDLIFITEIQVHRRANLSLIENRSNFILKRNEFISANHKSTNTPKIRTSNRGIRPKISIEKNLPGA